MLVGLSLSLALAGCGGNVAVGGGTTTTKTTPSTTSTTGAGGAGAGGHAAGGHAAGGSGAGGQATDCPATPPGPGASCSKAHLRCTYGDSALPECRATYFCEGSTWAAAANDCPEAPACTDGQTNGVACDGSDGARCLRSGTTICICSMCPEGMCHAPPSSWSCALAPGSPCPPLVPNDGSACSVEGAYCSYGFPCGGSGAVADCTAGAWVWAQIGCPL
jgi:hypothetical protein